MFLLTEKKEIGWSGGRTSEKNLLTLARVGLGDEHSIKLV